MGLSRIIELPLRYKPWRPRNFRLIIDEVFRRSPRTLYTPVEHLRATIDWLCRAQDARAGKPDAGGVSAGWAFGHGWLPSYPETSGYIIETFIEAARILDRPELTGRAHRILDWELSIQHEDGAFPGHHGEPGSKPVIFNTGQIMHGMLAGHLQLGRPECLESAVRGAHWLARCWQVGQVSLLPPSVHVASIALFRSIRTLARSALPAGPPACMITSSSRDVAGTT